MGTEKVDEIINRPFSEVGREGNTADSRNDECFLPGTFADLIDVMDIAMWQLDSKYRVVGFNKKASEIYGEDALGKFCYDAAANRDTVCEICPARMVYDGQASGRSEHKRINVAGEEIYIDHIATPIKDQEGRVTGTLVLIIDITRHKTQERELLEHRNNLEEMVASRTQELHDTQERYRLLYEKSNASEKLYRSLLNSSADAIIVYNLEGEVQYLNPSFSEIFGWHLDELQGEKIPFVPESEKNSCDNERSRLLATGESSRNFPTKRWTKDGQLLDIYISASIYDDHEGNSAGILVIMKDVTAIKAMQNQLYHGQKIEALATLAGGIAHDFNNLLMGIQGNTSLLLEETKNQGVNSEKLKNIEKYVQRGSLLTKQLLGLSKGGKYEVKPSNINKLISDCANMFGASKKEIKINTDFEKDIWPVEVDRGQIEQVLLNLFLNAAQAMPMGGELYLETRNIILNHNIDGSCQRNFGKYVEIKVKDTGVGIEDSIKDKIFDPFFTTKTKERGSGLGLASAYGIISNHAGSISVKSSVGVGSTFTIFLPMSKKQLGQEKVTSDVLVIGNERVMLIDDEEMVTEVGKQLLEILGYNAITVNSGQDALELLEKDKDMVDLVILDMIMPGLSGYETFSRIKSLNPKIKTLLSSGYSLDSQASDILACGCGGFLQKPFNLNELSLKVREVLDA